MRFLFARRERLDRQRYCQLVDLFQQGLREWHAVLVSIGHACRTALPRDMDFIETGQPLRRCKIVYMAINLGLECIKRKEARDIERDDKLTGIVFTQLVAGRILDVTSVRRPDTATAEKPEYQRKTATLVAGKRHEHAFRKASTIGNRRTILPADHPSFRHRLAFC